MVILAIQVFHHIPYMNDAMTPLYRYRLRYIARRLSPAGRLYAWNTRRLFYCVCSGTSNVPEARAWLREYAKVLLSVDVRPSRRIVREFASGALPRGLECIPEFRTCTDINASNYRMSLPCVNGILLGAVAACSKSMETPLHFVATMANNGCFVQSEFTDVVRCSILGTTSNILPGLVYLATTLILSTTHNVCCFLVPFAKALGEISCSQHYDRMPSFRDVLGAMPDIVNTAYRTGNTTVIRLVLENKTDTPLHTHIANWATPVGITSCKSVALVTFAILVSNHLQSDLQGVDNDECRACTLHAIGEPYVNLARRGDIGDLEAVAMEFVSTSGTTARDIEFVLRSRKRKRSIHSCTGVDDILEQALKRKKTRKK